MRIFGTIVTVGSVMFLISLYQYNNFVGSLALGPLVVIALLGAVIALGGRREAA